ncbi:hypothetical protein LEP1GSC195_2724 [Leptospira wolbachii serovar Codice str. CDC]|uniref:Uncharacterized protein n=1 Tax=Leptospira wolbachii serovar Codice str. CDC TaxID=1218599 RepID=R9A112_9LEPT|nr:hypothetical protein LEP1GSC195_2724 [Leptospira wolbachii serovar Codice str. CDC]
MVLSRSRFLSIGQSKTEPHSINFIEWARDSNYNLKPKTETLRFDHVPGVYRT